MAKIGTKTVISEDGRETANVTSQKRCSMHGCTGVRLRCVWPDKHHTWPCTKGMHVVSNTVMRIGAKKETHDD